MLGSWKWAWVRADKTRTSRDSLHTRLRAPRRATVVTHAAYEPCGVPKSSPPRLRGATMGSLHLAHGLAPNPPQQLRERSGNHERATVEQLLNEARSAVQLET